MAEAADSAVTCRTPVGMITMVRLPGDLAQRLSAAAAERGLSPDELAADAIEAHLPQHRLAFVGMGDSGEGGGDIGYRGADGITITCLVLAGHKRLIVAGAAGVVAAGDAVARRPARHRVDLGVPAGVEGRGARHL